MNQFYLLIPTLIVVLTTSHAQIRPTETPSRWRWSLFPNPQTNYRRCGRDHPSYVCDPNQLITYKGANELDKIINRTSRAASCPCGAQICIQSDRKGFQLAVAIVPEFYTRYNGTNHDKLLLEARRFAYGVYKRWDFGSCGEWVFIFFTERQRIVYTLTGPIARSRLNDTLVEQITMDAREYFAAGRDKNYTRGLIQMAEDYTSVFRGAYRRRPFVRAARIKQDKDKDSGAAAAQAAYFLTTVAVFVNFVRQW